MYVFVHVFVSLTKVYNSGMQSSSKELSTLVSDREKM